MKSAEERFQEASKPLKESVMHHMEAAAEEEGGQGYDSSSDEDFDDDKILSTTYEAYAGQIGEFDTHEFTSTQGLGKLNIWQVINLIAK